MHWPLSWSRRVLLVITLTASPISLYVGISGLSEVLTERKLLREMVDEYRGLQALGQENAQERRIALERIDYSRHYIDEILKGHGVARGIVGCALFILLVGWVRRLAPSEVVKVRRARVSGSSR